MVFSVASSKANNLVTVGIVWFNNFQETLYQTIYDTIRPWFP